MRHQTRKARRGANLAAARAVKAQRDAERIARTTQRRTVNGAALAWIVREYIRGAAGDDGTCPLATVQAGAERGTPGAALTLTVWERLAQRHTARRRGIVAAMREDNNGPTRVRLAWPETADRTPDGWRRRIVAPSSGIARLAWREVLVREGAKAAAEWCEARGIVWTYPAEPGAVASGDAAALRETASGASAAADREALASGAA